MLMSLEVSVHRIGCVGAKGCGDWGLWIGVSEGKTIQGGLVARQS